jgi:DNA-binding transcriptional ArsR family regulator
MQTNGPRSEWYVVSSHGALLFFIAANPGCTTEDIVSGMHLTQRTVWGLIGDLRRAGMLTIRREGRRHYYSVNMSGDFRHPTLSGIKLGTIVGKIARDSVAAGAN